MSDYDDDAQPALPIVDVHTHRSRAEQLRDACKRAVKAHGGNAKVAAELDAIFCKLGHPVSEGTLKNALGDVERNYVRAEWIPYFASISDEVAELVAAPAGCVLAVGRTKLTPQEEIDLTKERVMREFGAAGARLLASIGGRRR